MTGEATKRAPATIAAMAMETVASVGEPLGTSMAGTLGAPPRVVEQRVSPLEVAARVE